MCVSLNESYMHNYIYTHMIYIHIYMSCTCNYLFIADPKKEWTCFKIGGLSALCNWRLCTFGGSGITIIWHAGWVASVDPSSIAW